MNKIWIVVSDSIKYRDWNIEDVFEDEQSAFDYKDALSAIYPEDIKYEVRGPYVRDEV